MPGRLGGSRRERLRDEQGSALILVCLFLTALTLFLMFAVDVGNWYVHQRHLQSQADAAALAGADDYLGYNCSDSTINATVKRYSGDSATAGTYNQQVQGAGAVRVVVNGAKYFDQGGSDYSDPNGSPCTARYIDVKLSETGVPLFFGGLLPGVSPTIRAHARVGIYQQTTTSYKSLPIGVPNPVPGYVRADFLDKNGTVVASDVLSDVGANGSGSLELFDDAASPLTVPVGSYTSVRIVASSGSSYTTCNAYTVQCYSDVQFIHSYDSTATAHPIMGDASFVPTTCADPYFNYMNIGATCNTGIQVKLDFGVSNPVTSYNASVTATLHTSPAGGTYDGQSYPLTYAGSNVWSLTSGPVTSDSQKLSFDISWQANKGKLDGINCNGTGTPCSGSWSDVQATYSGGPTSTESLQLVQLINPATSATGYNSMSQGSKSIVVRAGFTSYDEVAADNTEPATVLRVSDGQNSSLDCDPAQANTKSELVNGCGPQYKIAANPTTDCASFNRGSASQPWPCVMTQSGVAVGQIVQGMTSRVLGSGTCAQHPNNWSSYPSIASGDTRFVSAFIVPFGAMNSPPNSELPILGFATFYITGWGSASGSGPGVTCSGDEPVNKGWIIGRFIRQVSSLTGTMTSSTLCPFTNRKSINNCVAVMTQ